MVCALALELVYLAEKYMYSTAHYWTELFSGSVRSQQTQSLGSRLFSRKKKKKNMLQYWFLVNWNN